MTAHDVSETELQARIRLALGRQDHTRLFRNTVGEGWVGKVIAKDRNTVLLARPYYVTFGLFPGSGDLIGWTSVTITPAMVGMKVAVFTSAEIKRRTGRIKTKVEQTTWRERVHNAGGFADQVRNEGDALRLVRAPVSDAR